MIFAESVEFSSAFGTMSIGHNMPSHMIAEIGLNHNGSVNLAKQLIQAAALSGAHSVKLQKRDITALASGAFLDAPFPKASYLGASQRDIRSRLELNRDEYEELHDYSTRLGLVFFASAFDPPSVNFLADMGVGLVKVASHSLTNGPLLKTIAETEMAVVLSTGGVRIEEIHQALQILDGRPVVLMHCVSSYPTNDTDLRLGTIGLLREHFGLPVGFSSHEEGTVGSIAAVALGAVAVERHFTLSRSMVGLDQAISLEPAEYAELTSAARRLHSMRGERFEPLASELQARSSYHVGLYACRNLPAGHVVQAGDLVALQPLVDQNKFFGGLEMDAVRGRQLLREVREGEAVPREAVS